MTGTTGTDTAGEVLAQWRVAAEGQRGEWVLRRRSFGLELKASGDLHQAIDPSFAQQAVTQLEQDGSGGVLIDIGGCRQLRSAAFSFLADFFHRAKNRNVRVMVVRPPHEVRVLLDILGMDRVFQFLDDPADATRVFRNKS